MTHPLSNTQMRDVASLIHPYTNAIALRETGPHVITHGQGIHVWDDAGKKYIEGMAGLWCCGLGFSDAELIDAAKAQLDRLPYYHLFGGRSFEPAVELAEKIKDLAPGNMAKVIYQSSGSEANDTQIKLQWYYNNALGRPEKKKIISRKKGYHGVTIVAASLTGLPYNHLDFDLPVARVHHAMTPHFWKEAQPGETESEFVARLAQDLTDLIEREGPDTVAAFIAEPVMGAGGVIVPPKGYFEAIQPILTAHDIAFICDEVITGFGRTGNWFGAQTWNITPDTMSMAKQMTGAYLPLSAVAMSAPIAEAIDAHSGKLGNFGHGFTYGGHPLGCAVGVKAIEIYQRRDIVGHVRTLSPTFARLVARAAEHPLVGEGRCSGLMGALELAAPGTKGFETPGRVGPRMAMELLKHGVILRAIGDVIAICPPMIITEAELEEMFDPVEKALDATMAWARTEGLLN